MWYRGLISTFYWQIDIINLYITIYSNYVLCTKIIKFQPLNEEITRMMTEQKQKDKEWKIIQWTKNHMLKTDKVSY